eukprot:gene1879-1146_t
MVRGYLTGHHTHTQHKTAHLEDDPTLVSWAVQAKTHAGRARRSRRVGAQGALRVYGLPPALHVLPLSLGTGTDVGHDAGSAVSGVLVHPLTTTHPTHPQAPHSSACSKGEVLDGSPTRRRDGLPKNVAVAPHPATPQRDIGITGTDAHFTSSAARDRSFLARLLVSFSFLIPTFPFITGPTDNCRSGNRRRLTVEAGIHVGNGAERMGYRLLSAVLARAEPTEEEEEAKTHAGRARRSRRVGAQELYAYTASRPLCTAVSGVLVHPLTTTHPTHPQAPHSSACSKGEVLDGSPTRRRDGLPKNVAVAVISFRTARLRITGSRIPRHRRERHRHHGDGCPLHVLRGEGQIISGSPFSFLFFFNPYIPVHHGPNRQLTVEAGIHVGNGAEREWDIDYYPQSWRERSQRKKRREAKTHAGRARRSRRVGAQGALRVYGLPPALHVLPLSLGTGTDVGHDAGSAVSGVLVHPLTTTHPTHPQAPHSSACSKGEVLDGSPTRRRDGLPKNVAVAVISFRTARLRITGSRIPRHRRERHRHHGDGCPLHVLRGEGQIISGSPFSFLFFLIPTFPFITGPTDNCRSGNRRRFAFPGPGALQEAGGIVKWQFRLTHPPAPPAALPPRHLSLFSTSRALCVRRCGRRRHVRWAAGRERERAKGCKNLKKLHQREAIKSAAPFHQSFIAFSGPSLIQSRMLFSRWLHTIPTKIFGFPKLADSAAYFLARSSALSLFPP